jgi:LysM repeat protein
MRLPSLFPTKKLRATAARRSLGGPDEMDYEEMSEPNMKLSRALLIVLVLHVVAVAGIIAFNAIKSRQGIVPPATSAKSSPQVSSQKPDSAAPTSSEALSKPRDEMATKPVVHEERKAMPVKATPESSPKSESKKTYVVAKGDTPTSISKKFKITSSQLLAANDIEDAHKLKIGQKLTIPQPKATPPKATKVTKATKPKKSE